MAGVAGPVRARAGRAAVPGLPWSRNPGCRRYRRAARWGRTTSAPYRTDALHKATGMLAGRYEAVAAEDLNVAGMTRNRKLSCAVNDQRFSRVSPMLAYETAWRGGRLATADRWFPSAKLCSGCWATGAKLSLSERTYHCEHYGLVLDRDVNAARNLPRLAARERRAKTRVER